MAMRQERLFIKLGKGKKEVQTVQAANSVKSGNTSKQGNSFLIYTYKQKIINTLYK